MDTQTILLVGVGGQGTILAGDLLAKCAAKEGYDVKLSEIHGMSQRGGSVYTVVRFGKKVHSMVCGQGCANYLISFEPIEALRSQQFLAKDGHAFVNSKLIAPASIVYSNSEVPSDIEERLHSLKACILNADDIAINASSPKSSNVVLMGSVSNVLPFSIDTWETVIAQRVPPKTVDKNIEAFHRGRKAAQF